MRAHAQEEQTLMKIQHERAEARVKGDSSYTRRLEAEDCTIVWPDGRIVNEEGNLQSMTGDIVFTEFKIDDVRVRLYADTGIVVGQGTIGAQKGKRSSPRKLRLDRHICETGRSLGGGRFADHSGLGKIIADVYE
jgi:Domain of unknown function (DUF4440)